VVRTDSQCSSSRESSVLNYHSRRGKNITKLKKRKAPRRQNEIWMYGTEGIVERLVEVMNEVWRGEGFPVDWREGVVCPIYKKGEKSKVEDYRRIPLLNTWYLYVSILSERDEERD
jgi:hypothetical protein